MNVIVETCHSFIT